MTDSNRLQSKCFQLFITSFIILSSNPSTVQSIDITESNKLLTFLQIKTSEKNQVGAVIFRFQIDNYTNRPTLEDNSSYEIQKDNNTFLVRLTKQLKEDEFTFKFKIDFTYIEVKGTFDKPSPSNSSTVVIAFLASLCLILFTALALSLIILRRKKPITFKFGQKQDKDCDTKQFEDNYDDNYENQNKNSSIDLTKNISTNNSTPIESPRVLQPRKSSLKPPSKSMTTDQLNNNFSAHENGAFNGTELEVVNEVNEEKIEEKPNIQETRRKSIVTFSDTTHVKYG